MDQLFAPWRIEWVTREEPENDECVFCTLPERDNDRQTLVVARSEQAYVLLNSYPYNPGHVMIIPRRHLHDPRALTGEELREQGLLLQRTLAALEASVAPDGFNTGMNLGRSGGGSIRHLHTHVVPRWEGDTNFMAVIDDTTVIVQALAETYEAVHDAFADQEVATGEATTGAVRLQLD